jgi:cytidyltransferase-like protein
MKPAKIITFEEFDSIRSELGRIVCASGGFDPIHPGHISYIYESRKFGDTVVVIVNGDAFLSAKKGKPFMNLETRSNIVAHIIGVDYVIPFEIKNDHTVNVALEKIKPHVFTKGGDRTDSDTIPEWQTCEQHGIEVITGVGADKAWSSSNYLENWLNHHK